MAITKQIHIKAEKAPESFMEMARTVDGYLFDEVVIKKISFVPEGRSIEFAYIRHMKRFDNLVPLVITPEEFRAAAMLAQQPGNHFGMTSVADKLFADGARQYADKNQTVVADAMADAEFIDSMGQ